MTFGALLDTCVLVPSTQRDLLLETASLGAFRPLWSTCIEQELRRTIKSLHAQRGREPEETQAYITRLLRNMNRALPDARVHGWEWMVDGVAGLPDPDDRHVVAAAAQGQAAIIVTANLKHFPDAALPGALFSQSPDEFLLDLSPGLVRHALQEIVGRSGVNGPRWSMDDLLDRLDTAELHGFTRELRPSRVDGT